MKEEEIKRKNQRNEGKRWSASIEKSILFSHVCGEGIERKMLYVKNPFRSSLSLCFVKHDAFGTVDIQFAEEFRGFAESALR